MTAPEAARGIALALLLTGVAPALAASAWVALLEAVGL